MLYNLNLPVKVKLTIKGLEVLKEYYYKKQERRMEIDPTYSFKSFQLPEVDKDGWTKFGQASELFEIFGEYSWLCNEPFSMEVDFCCF